ncbi:MAG: glucokinase [Alphaproteobacteria bacterium]|nr:glucokinase [Alphaproteobacteria bacterium]
MTGPASAPKLLADIGGTNARFAVLGEDGEIAHFETLACGDYPDLASAAAAYLESLGLATAPREAAFAIAAPVSLTGISDDVTFTNLAWSFSVAQTKERLALARLEVVNDFTAIALALPHLETSDLEQVGGGTAQEDGVKAVLGPGTGLGVSGLVPSSSSSSPSSPPCPSSSLSGDWTPLASEGGHVTMAAANDRESAVLGILRGKFGHVSAERLLSGPGLVNIAGALAQLESKSGADKTPDEITRRALSGECGLCAEALDMFCAMLGTVAADLALTLGARGGVYIAGGIVPRLGPAFAASPFRGRFEDKGRYSDYLPQIPSWVITRDAPAFAGLRALILQG